MRFHFTVVLLAVLMLSLSACSYIPQPGPTPSQKEVVRLRQQQRDMKQELQSLRDELARLRGEPKAKTPSDKGPSQPTTDQPTDRAAEQRQGSATYRQAVIDYSAGRYARASTGFQSFIDQNPSSPFRLGAYYWLGKTFTDLKQPEKAVVNYEQLLWEAPQNHRNPEILGSLITLYQQTNQPEKARDARTILQQRYPDSPETRRAIQSTIAPAQVSNEGTQ